MARPHEKNGAWATKETRQTTRRGISNAFDDVVSPRDRPNAEGFIAREPPRARLHNQRSSVVCRFLFLFPFFLVATGVARYISRSWNRSAIDVCIFHVSTSSLSGKWIGRFELEGWCLHSSLLIVGLFELGSTIGIWTRTLKDLGKWRILLLLGNNLIRRIGGF